jgi:CelD/BcsL family acetyltransferase involved in cellulose biosynthesis
MTTVIAWPRFMNPEMSAEYSGGELIFQDLLKKELVKPRVKKKGCTRYDRVEIDNALDQWAGFDSK